MEVKLDNGVCNSCVVVVVVVELLKQSILAIVIELCALFGCAVTTVLTTLAIAKDAQRLKKVASDQGKTRTGNTFKSA